MASKVKRVTAVGRRGKGSSSVNGSGVSLREDAARRPHERALCRRLTKVHAVHTVFLATDDDGTIHVYSVVPDYPPDLYDKLLKQERLVEKEFPKLIFEFHLRAHQGREPVRAVPFGSQPLFV